MNSNKNFKRTNTTKNHKVGEREDGLLGDVNVIDVTSTNEGTHPNRSNFQF
jgi:hypothetical protein